MSRDRDAARAWALIRLAALPVIFVGERLVSHPRADSGLFGPLLIVAAVYAIAAALAAFDRLPWRPPVALTAALDLVAIGALTYTSGGPFSQVRYGFFLLPVGAAVLLRPPLTAAASLASVAGYVIVSLTYPVERAGDYELAQALYLAWLGMGAVVLSVLLTRRTEAIEALSAMRGRLVAQALDAEDRERRRLAEALHDDAIQSVLAARQELAGPGGGDLDFARRGLDRTVGQLREAVFDLHPYLLEHAGLEAALRAVLERAAERDGLIPTVEVDPDAAGVRDALVFSIARELIANAVRHAHGTRIDVRVRRPPGELVVEVSDDGRGLDRERLRAAPREGHIGLASITERVEALDGRLEIASAPGQGTMVRARLPVEDAPPAVAPAPPASVPARR